MVNFALNHMTVANASFEELLIIARQSGCCGVELRNDLAAPMFGGLVATAAAKRIAASDLKIFALAEVKSFNHLTAQTVPDTENLAALGKACGAQGLALIPANDGTRLDEATRRKDLTHALSELVPILESYDLTGFVEPLGFASSSIRSKREVVEVIESLNVADRIKLVHDTFHHFVAGETECFAQHTGMVHVSGVVDAQLAPDQMQDAHRVLVTKDDLLQNVEQLAMLAANGYRGPVSMEAFAREVHDFTNPAEHLQNSFQFISSGLAARVA